MSRQIVLLAGVPFLGVHGGMYYKLRRGLFTNGVMADLKAKKDVAVWEGKKAYQGVFGKMHGTFSRNTTTTRQGRFTALPTENI